MNNESILDDGVVNILGEILWHSATTDGSILAVSEAHAHEVLTKAERHRVPQAMKQSGGSVRFLEVAAYAHFTGYLLAERNGWQSTVSDISVETLALGAKHALQAGVAIDTVRKVAVDFHDLPFADASFDVVYISSALHHTLRWGVVLRELMRVTARGGILIMQNEPCQRDFCFYKFPTNRPHAFRPIETLLEQQGVLKTIGEPFIGSRPESLFGMIENQKMPITDILAGLRVDGQIIDIAIDSDCCLSEFDRSLLRAPRHSGALAVRIELDLLECVRAASAVIDATDAALGIRMPTDADIAAMAKVASERIVGLPSVDSPDYPVALAALFGGALTVVVRKMNGSERPLVQGDPLYPGATRKGIAVSYPPKLTKVLDLAHDLVPDIQIADAAELQQHFPGSEWTMYGNADLRYLILNGTVGTIRLRQSTAKGIFVVLLRVYANPVNCPFRLQLLVGDTEIAGTEVYQQDSFLLRGQLPGLDGDSVLTLRATAVDGQPLASAMPVTVPAVRVVCISGTT